VGDACKELPKELPNELPDELPDELPNELSNQLPLLLLATSLRLAVAMLITLTTAKLPPAFLYTAGKYRRYFIIISLKATLEFPIVAPLSCFIVSVDAAFQPRLRPFNQHMAGTRETH
jgi:hypothetical protein